MSPEDSSFRIEPARLEDPGVQINDLVAELSAAAAILGHSLHSRTAASLASLVRLMNAYYSNLIEGHNTRPRDIELALAGTLDGDAERRNLQLEAAAHVRLQAKIDSMAAEGVLPEPASAEFIRWLHSEFYRDAPEEFLRLETPGRHLMMQPGAWRSLPAHDVRVGRHSPPSSIKVEMLMKYFEMRYRMLDLGKSARILVMAASHHRFNYIHPFPDGNGRVSRLMSHAMGHSAAIGAHGLWSISRGLARGLSSRAEYKQNMDLADSPREGDLDGRGNLSLRALREFVAWFLSVSLDQVKFMSGLFELPTLSQRLRRLVESDDSLKPQSFGLLDSALLLGEFERGEAARITGLPERSARRVLNDLVEKGLLASDTPKGAVSLRFPVSALDVLFPKLFPQL